MYVYIYIGTCSVTRCRVPGFGVSFIKLSCLSINDYDDDDDNNNNNNNTRQSWNKCKDINNIRTSIITFAEFSYIQI